MWQPKQPGVEMKSKASGKPQKRKQQDGSGAETESEALGQTPKKICRDETELLSKEYSKALKKTLWEDEDLEIQRDQPGKGQVQKLQEETPTQPKSRECFKRPPEQAVTQRKPAGSRQGLKRPYSIMEGNEQSTPKAKHLKCVEDPHLDPHRPHPNTSKMKGHSHGSETTPKEQEPSTPDERERSCSEEKSFTQKRGDINHDGKGGNNLEPDSPGTPALIILDSAGGDSLLPNEKAVLAAEEKLLANLENGRQVDQNFHVTEDMEKEIESALGPGPQEEILSRGFKLQITRRDIQTLKTGQWLNDEVINFYMNLLVERNENRGYPALHVFSTFFYPKLKHSGYTSVKRWTRGVNLFDKELILVPIHQRVHWSLVVIDLRKQSIVYLDSMGQAGKTVCETIFQYLQNESKTRRNIDLDPLAWKQYSMTAEEIPQQLNGSDCGMFTCKYADYITRDQPVTFSQQHMPIFRKRMVWEILHSHLL